MEAKSSFPFSPPVSVTDLIDDLVDKTCTESTASFTTSVLGRALRNLSEEQRMLKLVCQAMEFAATREDDDLRFILKVWYALVHSMRGPKTKSEPNVFELRRALYARILHTESTLRAGETDESQRYRGEHGHPVNGIQGSLGSDGITPTGGNFDDDTSAHTTERSQRHAKEYGNPGVGTSASSGIHGVHDGHGYSSPANCIREYVNEHISLPVNMELSDHGSRVVALSKTLETTGDSIEPHSLPHAAQNSQRHVDQDGHLMAAIPKYLETGGAVSTGGTATSVSSEGVRQSGHARHAEDHDNFTAVARTSVGKDGAMPSGRDHSTAACESIRHRDPPTSVSIQVGNDGAMPNGRDHCAAACESIRDRDPPTSFSKQVRNDGAMPSGRSLSRTSGSFKLELASIPAVPSESITLGAEDTSAAKSHSESSGIYTPTHQMVRYSGGRASGDASKPEHSAGDTTSVYLSGARLELDDVPEHVHRTGVFPTSQKIESGFVRNTTGGNHVSVPGEDPMRVDRLSSLPQKVSSSTMIGPSRLAGEGLASHQPLSKASGSFKLDLASIPASPSEIQEHSTATGANMSATKLRSGDASRPEHATGDTTSVYLSGARLELDDAPEHAHRMEVFPTSQKIQSGFVRNATDGNHGGVFGEYPMRVDKLSSVHPKVSSPTVIEASRLPGEGLASHRSLSRTSGSFKIELASIPVVPSEIEEHSMDLNGKDTRATKTRSESSGTSNPTHQMAGYRGDRASGDASRLEHAAQDTTPATCQSSKSSAVQDQDVRKGLNTTTKCLDDLSTSSTVRKSTQGNVDADDEEVSSGMLSTTQVPSSMSHRTSENDEFEFHLDLSRRSEFESSSGFGCGAGSAGSRPSPSNSWKAPKMDAPKVSSQAVTKAMTTSSSLRRSTHAVPICWKTLMISIISLWRDCAWRRKRQAARWCINAVSQNLATWHNVRSCFRFWTTLPDVKEKHPSPSPADSPCDASPVSTPRMQRDFSEPGRKNSSPGLEPTQGISPMPSKRRSSSSTPTSGLRRTSTYSFWKRPVNATPTDRILFLNIPTWIGTCRPCMPWVETTRMRRGPTATLRLRVVFRSWQTLAYPSDQPEQSDSIVPKTDGFAVSPCTAGQGQAGLRVCWLVWKMHVESRAARLLSRAMRRELIRVEYAVAVMWSMRLRRCLNSLVEHVFCKWCSEVGRMENHLYSRASPACSMFWKGAWLFALKGLNDGAFDDYRFSPPSVGKSCEREIPRYFDLRRSHAFKFHLTTSHQLVSFLSWAALVGRANIESRLQRFGSVFPHRVGSKAWLVIRSWRRALTGRHMLARRDEEEEYVVRRTTIENALQRSNVEFVAQRCFVGWSARARKGLLLRDRAKPYTMHHCSLDWRTTWACVSVWRLLVSGHCVSANYMRRFCLALLALDVMIMKDAHARDSWAMVRMYPYDRMLMNFAILVSENSPKRQSRYEHLLSSICFRAWWVLAWRTTDSPEVSGCAFCLCGRLRTLRTCMAINWLCWIRFASARRYAKLAVVLRTHMEHKWLRCALTVRRVQADIIKHFLSICLAWWQRAVSV